MKLCKVWLEAEIDEVKSKVLVGGDEESWKDSKAWEKQLDSEVVGKIVIFAFSSTEENDFSGGRYHGTKNSTSSKNRLNGV